MTTTKHPQSKTEKSVRSYLNKLHDQHSKIVALRVDFGYKKETSKDSRLEDIKRDIKHLLDNRRNNKALFEHQVGYVMKFEQTPEKGPHVHALLLYDGQHVQKDAHLADRIGEYWNRSITSDAGVYHNCNRSKHDYAKCGIGMIDHSDQEKRSALLDSVVPYMLKSEQSIDPIRQSGKERSVTKGIAPKKSTNSGRPRASKVGL